MRARASQNRCPVPRRQSRRRTCGRARSAWRRCIHCCDAAALARGGEQHFVFEFAEEADAAGAAPGRSRHRRARNRRTAVLVAPIRIEIRDEEITRASSSRKRSRCRAQPRAGGIRGVVCFDFVRARNRWRLSSTRKVSSEARNAAPRDLRGVVEPQGRIAADLGALPERGATADRGGGEGAGRAEAGRGASRAPASTGVGEVGAAGHGAAGAQGVCDGRGTSTAACGIMPRR